MNAEIEDQVGEADRACPVCGETATTASGFSAGEWRVGDCTGCGMTYLVNPPGQESLMDEHAWEETRGKERQKRREKRKVYYFFSDGLKKIRAAIRQGKRKELSFLEALGPSGGRILDIGCAEGGTLIPIDKGKWQPFGIEPSPGLAKQADAFCAEHGGRVVQETAVGGLPEFEENYFDAVMMRSFLEHEAHVGEVLSGVHRVLKPGGFTIIKVPNAACWNAKLRGGGWPGVRHPDHVNYFTPGQLRRVVADAGFAEVKFPWSWRSPTSDNMWMAAYKKSD